MLLLTLTLTGCANKSFTNAADTPEVSDQVEKMFFGVPLVLALEGSRVRLNDEWVLTAKHNSPILPADTIYHPTCDIALVPSKIDQEVEAKVGAGYSHDDFYFAGYPLAHGYTVTEGKYLGDLYIDDWEGCTFSATTNGIGVGMSGGGVFTADGNLVGIIHGFTKGTVTWNDGTTYKKPAVFVSLMAVKDWLYEHTGVQVKED